MPDWSKIKQEFESTDITLKALADKHKVKLGTLKSRRSREGWERDATNATEKHKDATSDKKDATPKKKVATSKGKKKRGGNPNPVRKFTKRNQAAVTHGLYRKHLPEDTADLIDEIENMHPADILWHQIKIQYAAIIRAQSIMFVADQNDHDRFISEDGKHSTKYEMHTSWDKQAKMLSAQSRAMSELRGSIRQFVAIADDVDERRLKLELMQSNIDKTNVEISKLKGDDLVEYEDDGFENALLGIESAWSDE